MRWSLLVAITLILGVLPLGRSATASSFSAQYVGESASVTALPGDRVDLVVVYANVGDVEWTPDTIGLLACLPEGECGRSLNDGYRDGWPSSGVYATVSEAVAPGDVAFFSYAVAIPQQAVGVTARFEGTVGTIGGSPTAIGTERFEQDVRVPDVGTAARLTISGINSPVVSAGDAITLAVDVDDVNVELVPGDETTIVHADLDPSSCSGAAAGPAYLASSDVTAVDGRAWFTVRSFGAYPACTVTVRSGGLRGSSARLRFDPAAPAVVTCQFAPRVLTDRHDMSIATVEAHDAYGNAISPFASLERVSGVSTDVISITSSAGRTFVVVRGSTPGTDVYLAHAGGQSGTCEVRVAG